MGSIKQDGKNTFFMKFVNLTVIFIEIL